MTPQKSSIALIKKSYKITLDSIKNRPAVLLPFFIFAILETLTLILICFMPRTPLVTIFGPPIKTFFGERFLHYPGFFLLVPKLSSLARMTLSVIFGSLLTGLAIILILDIYHKRQIKLNHSLNLALKKYAALFLIYLLVTALFYYSVKMLGQGLVKYFMAGHAKLLFLNARLWLGPVLLGLNFLIALFIQSIFIYAVPVLIIEKAKLFSAIGRSFLVFKKLFIPTIILVGAPMLIYVPIILLNANSAFLIDKFFPEFIMLVTFLSIVVSSLIIDPLITISTTFLYLINKEG